MGSVSMAISSAAREAGAHIVTRAEVFFPNITSLAFVIHLIPYY